MNKLIKKLDKLNNYISDRYLKLQISFIFWNVNDNIFLIPTIEVSVCGKYFELNIHILSLTLYFCLSLENYNDES